MTLGQLDMWTQPLHFAHDQVKLSLRRGVVCKPIDLAEVMWENPAWAPMVWSVRGGTKELSLLKLKFSAPRENRYQENEKTRH